jgi:hypothetical protein
VGRGDGRDRGARHPRARPGARRAASRGRRARVHRWRAGRGGRRPARRRRGLRAAAARGPHPGHARSVDASAVGRPARRDRLHRHGGRARRRVPGRWLEHLRRLGTAAAVDLDLGAEPRAARGSLADRGAPGGQPRRAGGAPRSGGASPVASLPRGVGGGAGRRAGAGRMAAPLRQPRVGDLADRVDPGRRSGGAAPDPSRPRRLPSRPAGPAPGRAAPSAA